MADLMRDTYDFQKLKTQYKDFLAPAAKLTIGKTNVLSLKEAHVRSIEAVLSLNSAGSVHLVLADCYDYKNGSFLPSLKNLAVLGKEVELFLGYGSKFQKVFKGFLASVEMVVDAEEGIFLEFTALDVRRLMMADNFHVKEHTITNYSDAVRDIMKRYQKLCTVSIEDTNEKFEDGRIYQNASDYDFIMKDLIESGRVEREFFVVADKAYFRKPRSVSSVLVTLGIGKGLTYFRRNAEYENQKVTVMGFDPAAGKSVENTALAKSTDAMSDVLGGAGERMIMDPSCESSSQAAGRAKGIAARLQARRQKAEGSCVGLPELVPGRFIRLERVDSIMNQKYYLTRVTHTYDSDGFQTSFQIEGWE